MPSRADLFGGPRPLGAGSASPEGPKASQAAVDQLISKAMKGALSAPEAAQLSQLLESPAMKDAFTSEQRKDLARSTRPPQPPLRDPAELTSDLSKLSDATELPDRFAADLVLARESLLEHNALMRADKATRLFQFVVPYAQALATLATSPLMQQQVAQKFLAQAQKAGYHTLEQQPGGRNGMTVLKDLFETRTPEEIARLARGLRFDAPIWAADDPHKTGRQPSAVFEPEQQPRGTAKTGEHPNPWRPTAQPPSAAGDRRKTDDDEGRRGRGTDKRLGTRTLWNVLHALRDDGEAGRDSAAQREALRRLAVAAGLLLLLMGLIAGVVVAL